MVIGTITACMMIGCIALCLAAVWCLVWSARCEYWIDVDYQNASGTLHHYYELTTHRQSVLLRIFRSKIGDASDREFSHFMEARVSRPRVMFQSPEYPWRFGFMFRNWKEVTTPAGRRLEQEFKFFAVPLALVIMLAAAPPTIWLTHWRRRRRMKRRLRRGSCAVCGYDMRATPKLCPECGSVPENASSDICTRTRS
jgi:hypothetical protein